MDFNSISARTEIYILALANWIAQSCSFHTLQRRKQSKLRLRWINQGFQVLDFPDPSSAHISVYQRNSSIENYWQAITSRKAPLFPYFEEISNLKSLF